MASIIDRQIDEFENAILHDLSLSAFSHSLGQFLPMQRGIQSGSS